MMPCGKHFVIKIKVQRVDECSAYHEISDSGQQVPIAVCVVSCQKQNHQYNKHAYKSGKYICKKEHFTDHMTNLTLLNIQTILDLRYSNVNVLMRDRTDEMESQKWYTLLKATDSILQRRQREAGK